MQRLWLVVAMSMALGSQATAASSVATHCAPEEHVIFSCATARQKVVSLCASPAITPTAGYVQYRFGHAGQEPELIYPITREHPKKHFQSGTLMYSGGGGAYVKFRQGEYAYVVFTGIGKGWAKEGVVVQQAGKQIAYIPCQGTWTSELGPAWFEQAAIPPDPGDFEIP